MRTAVTNRTEKKKREKKGELEKLTLFVVPRAENALELGHVFRQAVVHQFVVAGLLLRAQLLHDGALALARLEVARVPGQLDPLVLAVLVRLDERGPLHHAAELAPAGGLRTE